MQHSVQRSTGLPKTAPRQSPSANERYAGFMLVFGHGGALILRVLPIVDCCRERENVDAL